MFSLKRSITAAFGLALVTALVKIAVSDHVGSLVRSADAAQIPPAPQVDVAKVVTRNIIEYQNYSGRFEAVDNVEVRPLVSGTIVAVHFKDGALVKKGDPLFTIDPQPFQAAVDQAAAKVVAAQARNSYATADWDRSKRLLPSNAISKREFDQTENKAKEAIADLKAVQASLESAKINLAYAYIKAPVTGRVSRAEMTVGNIVSNGANAPLLTTLVSVSPIYAAFDVDEQTYLHYLSRSAQQAIPVSLGLADEQGFSRDGVVDSVDNRLDTRSGTIRVRARVENKDGRLIPGLYARVKVGAGVPHEAMLIDDLAIGTDQAKKFVLIVDADNKASYREVTLGGLQEGLRIITSGLNQNERIVVNGIQRVRPNEKVQANYVEMVGAVAKSQDAS